MTSLILKRGKLSRSSGQWSDEDYDVTADGKVVGPHLRGRLGLDAARAAVVLVRHRDSAGDSQQHERPRRDPRRGEGEVSPRGRRPSRNIGPAEGFANSRKLSRATSQGSAPTRKRLRLRFLEERTLAYLRKRAAIDHWMAEDEYSDREMEEEQAVDRFLREHGQSLDWVLMGDPSSMICWGAAASPRMSSITRPSKMRGS